MKCYMCGKTENEIKEIVEKIIRKLQDKYSSNMALIEDSSEVKMIEKYSQENNFTKENKELVHTIDNNLKEMGIKAFLENYKTFIKMENKLEILYKYFTKNNINHYNKEPQNIKDLIELFCDEPDENKIKYIKQERNNIITNIEAENKSIGIAVEKLKKSNKYLFERDISFKHYEIPETQLLRYSYDTYNKNIDIEPIIQKCCPDEYKNATKLILCPFCKAMFADAANGAFNSLQAAQDYD